MEQSVVMPLADRLFIGMIFTLTGVVLLLLNERVARWSIQQRMQLLGPYFGKPELLAGRAVAYLLGAISLVVGVLLLLGVIPPAR